MEVSNRIKKFLKLVAVGVLVVSFSSMSLAQQNEEDVPKKSGTRRQLATIIFSGLGGAVVGLSTLSCYGRPQDRLSNIAIGFAVGVIAGTIFTTYQTATKPREYLGQESERQLLLTQRGGDFAFQQNQASPTLGWNFSF